ncbi:hypothetical protein Tco_1015628 [Tanacetum coccineum]|uniref:Uncharacterized protein n=1 Tax=Tanacetum coccineum TaxID=301880 RepID=A0ABQ5FMG3_9ASTR
MPQICPNLPGQKFVDPPFEEEILTFIRELGYPGDINSLFDVKVDTLYQPWRTFGTIINKCLSGKETGLDQLCLSRAQIIWGMYNQKKVDYVYLLCEDLVYQIENKVSKKNRDMYYPRFTKVIINHFMPKDQSIPRRNKVDWHMANDDPILITMTFIPKHETVQKYGAIIPNTLTNQAMKQSDKYKTYHDFATGKAIPKPKYVRRSTRENTNQAPTASPGKRLKATAKVAKSGKKKLSAQGLVTLSEIALSEAEQMKIKSSNEDDDDEVSFSQDDDDNADNEDDDGQDDDNEQTESDNDGEDFVHPKFSIHDEEERQDEEDKDEEGSDLRVQTPSHFETTNDETYDDVTQGDNVEGEELDDEDTNEKADMNELYMDVNVNLEGRVTEMTDALLANSSSVSSGFISNMLNLNPDTGIDSILNLNNESTSLVDVPVTSNVEMPLSSVTTLPPPPIPLFEDRVKALEDDFSELKQTNLFAKAVSSILGIVDTYLANKMNEAVKIAVQLQSDRLRSEAQADNEDFINKIDENIIDKLVNDQLKAEVLIHSSNEAKTSHVIAANLSELELKKILIDKMENNKSIDRSVQHKTLYKALVDAYGIDKDILATYGDSVTFKRRRDDEDEDEEPSAGSNQGSKRRRAGKEPESTSAPKKNTSKSTGKSKEGSKSHQKSTDKSAQAEEPIHTVEDLEEPANQEFNTGYTEDQHVDETTQFPDCNLARKEDPCESFNELMDTPLDFSAFVLNRLKVDTLNPELLVDPTFELLKGSCKSLVELEYFLEEVCKATTDQLDWNNPEGQQYPHDLRKPLPLIPNSRGRRVIPFDNFINNDLAYLSGDVSSRTYATSVTKTKAADYGHIKWIEDLVPNTMWINRECARDVYSRHIILAVTKLKIVNWHNYKHLDWITVHRNDDKLYTFKEGSYNRLRLQDIEDMLLLLVQGKLTNLNVEERLALGVSLRMFTRSIVLRRCVEDLQLGVESYQKKLNLTRSDTCRSDLKCKLAYTTYSNPRGFIYQNKDKKNRLMCNDELYKFSDSTLNDVRSTLDDILKRIRMKCLPQTVWRNVDK